MKDRICAYTFASLLIVYGTIAAIVVGETYVLQSNATVQSDIYCTSMWIWIFCAMAESGFIAIVFIVTEKTASTLGWVQMTFFLAFLITWGYLIHMYTTPKCLNYYTVHAPYFITFWAVSLGMVTAVYVPIQCNYFCSHSK